MLDNIADIFLTFANRPFILLLVIIMGVLYSKELAYQAVCLVTLAIILNIALKGVFQVPLPRPLESATGYSFPSGHMMVSTVFYTWLALYSTHWSVRLLIGFILIGIGASLIHYNFHTIWDVLAGLGFGFVLVIAFIYVLLKERRWSPIVLLMIASLLMLYNWFIYPVIPIDSWRAYCILAIFIIVEQAVSLKTKKYQYWRLRHIPEPLPLFRKHFKGKK